MEHLQAGGAPRADVVDASVVLRALALLDQGRAEAARDLLAGALATAGPDFETFDRAPGAGFDAELDGAFEAARPETDAMIDADGIAFEAMRRAHLDEPEAVSLPPPDSPFHTRTLADLLERQGDPESAHAIRAALGAAGPEAPPAAGALDAARRARTIQTLERWLARLRGGDA